MRSLIYGNLYSRRAAGSATGENYAYPRLQAGQQWTVGLRFLDRVDGANAEIFPAVRSVRASLGLVDARPVSGTLAWQVGAGASTSGNTTGDFDHNAAAGRVAEALNGLDGVETEVSVDFDLGSYLIRAADGGKVEIMARRNRLAPVSFARVRYYQEGEGAWVTEVRYVVAPFAFTDVAERVLPPPPFITTIQNGYAESTWLVNEKQRLTIPPDFRGQYFFRQGLKKSNLLSLSDGEEEIAGVLDGMLAGEGGRVQVTNVDDGVADIVFLGDLSGVDVEEMSIEVPPEGAPPGDWTFTLDLDRAEVWAALRVRDEVSVVFEVELEVWLEEGNPDAGTRVVKVLRDEVVLYRPLLWDGLATDQQVNWLRPVSPRDYRRFSLDTVITGQQHYVSLPFGDGEQVGFVFDHELGTSALSGIEVLNVETGAFLVRGTEYSIPESDENSLTLEFVEAPATGQLRCIVTSAGPVSRFIDGLTVEIDQVNGLQLIIDDLSQRVAVLESILPTTGMGSTGASEGLVIPLPEVREVLFLGKPFEVGEKGGPVDLPRRGGLLLPGIHTAENETELPSPLPKPGVAGAGALFVNAGESAVLIPGGGGIRSASVQPGGFVGCDGRILYPVSRDGETNSYFATGFERELFMFYVSERMLRVNRTLECRFGVQVQLVGANSRGSWLLEIQTGTAPQDLEPETTGPNLQDVVWNPVPVLRERIVVSHLLVPHLFGVRIKRGVAGLSLDVQEYGVWDGKNEAAPDGPAFALRARLINFDTENSVPGARGWLFYELVGGVDRDEEGKQKTLPAQATIN